MASNIFEYSNPIISEMRTNAVPITQPAQIITGRVLIQEFPDKLQRVAVSGGGVSIWVETNDAKDLETKTNMYYVDYVSGAVYFNPIHNNKQITLSFYGEGVQFFPVSRIWTKQAGGNVVETLEDIIEAGEGAIGNLEELTKVMNETKKATREAIEATDDMRELEGLVEQAEASRVTAEQGRGNAENQRKTAENTRVSNENTRIADENTRKSNEEARVTAENQRKTNETNRQNAETIRETNEQSRISNEDQRKADEVKRETNETTRQNNEDQRKTAEEARVVAENERVSAENERKNAESIRNENETARDDAEKIRQTNEQERIRNENERKSNEEKRVTDENARNENEQNREVAEATRESNEEARVANENERITNEENRETAETTRESNEEERKRNEVDRQTNENDRQLNEDTRQQNEQSRISNEDKRNIDELNRENAEQVREANELVRQQQEEERQQNTAIAIENAEKATQDAQNVVDNTKGVGIYSESTTYKKNNIVTYNGSSYLALQDDIVGIKPDSDPSKWQLVAQRGVDGLGSVVSVNSIGPDLDGNVQLSPSDIGAETPEGSQAKVDLHASETYGVHSSTHEARPSRIVLRDPNGRAKIVDPVDPDHIATKGYVDSQASDTLATAKDYTDEKMLDAGKVKSVNNKIGDVVLTAEDVGAATPADVENVDNKIGNLDDLKTENKNNTVSAINENADKIGLLNELTTDEKSNLVGAINEVNSEVGKINDQLDSSPPTPITITAGTQTITVDRDTPFAVLNITGRTLVNLLGSDGNCESTNKIYATGGTLTLDTSTKVYGNSSAKVTKNASGASLRPSTFIYPQAIGDCFVAIAEVFATIAPTSLYISWTPSAGLTADISDFGTGGLTSFRPVVRRFKITSLSTPGTDKFQAYVQHNGGATDVFYVDGFRVYKITQSEYEALGGMTAEQIAAKYPYVDSIQNVNAVYTTTKAEDGRESYMYLPTCQLASNLDGSVADRMYMDNEGKPRVLRQFRRVELDGSLNWRDIDIRYPNFKQVIVSNFTSNYANQGNFVKYDGTILENFSGTPTGPDLATISQSNGVLHVTIANSDSGWGPNYTPTQDEIKAYFYGWKMYDENIKNDGTSLYNNDPGAVKRWTPIDSFDGSRYYGVYNGPGAPTESPTSANTLSTYRKNRDWTPYLLQYQLATPVDEPLEHEGSLMLYEGSNQVEVGTGILVREAFGPYLSNGLYYFNAGGSGNAKWRVGKIIDICKNGNRDQWDIKTRELGNGYNNYGAQFATKAQIDPSAVYQVTYLALDTYKIGIAPTEINAEYAANLRGTVDSLVEGNKNALARISVVESQMQMKEPSTPQWITPALLNGWVPYGAAFPIGYSKDDAGNVWIKGLVKGGTVSNNPETGVIFVLPKGYRPAEQKSFSVRSDTTSQSVLGAIILEPDGRVRAFAGSNVLLSLSEVSFRAEQ